MKKQQATSDAEVEEALRRLENAESTLEAARKNYRSEDNIKVQELELQKAEAALIAAELSLQSAEKFAAKGFLSKVQLEESRATREQKKIELEEARQRLKKIKPQE